MNLDHVSSQSGEPTNLLELQAMIEFVEEFVLMGDDEHISVLYHKANDLQELVGSESVKG